MPYLASCDMMLWSLVLLYLPSLFTCFMLEIGIEKSPKHCLRTCRIILCVLSFMMAEKNTFYSLLVLLSTGQGKSGNFFFEKLLWTLCIWLNKSTSNISLTTCSCLAGIADNMEITATKYLKFIDAYPLPNQQRMFDDNLWQPSAYWFSRVLIFANGRLEKISRILIFANREKEIIFLNLYKKKV